MSVIINGMTKLAQHLYQAEQVRAMERYAIETLELSGTVLMERAGAAAFARLQQHWPDASRICVVCGTGNNGGDGFVIARLAKEAGLRVAVMQVGDSSKLQGDALAAAQRLQSVEIIPCDYDRQNLLTCDVVVDAILGIGISGLVQDEYQQVIQSINSSGRPVLAVDVPSGLNIDSGEVAGVAIKADLTVTFIGIKRGLYCADAFEHTGQCVLETLNLPSEVYQQVESQVQHISYTQLSRLLKPRLRNTHKGDYGHVLIVGGDHGYTGAVRMAGEAAARTGAGLVSIATRATHASALNVTRPELMVHGIEDEMAFNRLAERATVIAIGPGLGQSSWGQQLLKSAMGTGLPMVVDADALNLLSLHPAKNDNWVLTPHVGEAARMLGQSTQEVQADRFVAVRALRKNYGGIAVLKGAGTCIAQDGGPLLLCSQGNPGMASGGMGDILTGIIAGLLAQGINQMDAASLGVCLHAAAGDAASAAVGERGLLAGDLFSWIRRLVNPVPPSA